MKFSFGCDLVEIEVVNVVLYGVLCVCELLI